MSTKKKIVLSTLLAFVIVKITFSQNFSSPESIAFDVNSGKYFVSNYDGGNIHLIDENLNISNSISGLSSPVGMAIYNDILYVSDNKTFGDDFVYGFNVITLAQVFSLQITGSQMLNDIAFDNSGTLYVSDKDADKIYKVDITNSTYTTLVNGAIGDPNGILFDSTNNRLLVCNTVTSGTIYGVDTTTGATTTVLNTGYANLDGMTQDTNGNIYVTSWGTFFLTSNILKYDANFSSAPEIILSNSTGMADLQFNDTNNMLAIPNYLTDSVTFLDQTAALSVNDFDAISATISPNPAKNRVHLSFKETITNATIQFVSKTGKIVLEEKHISGKNVSINIEKLSSGIYFISVINNGRKNHAKIIIQ